MTDMFGLTRIARFTGVGMGLLLVALSAGCLGRSPASDHFVLGSNGLLPIDRRAPELAVLIGPVRLPTYLDRPQIARLHSGGKVELDEYARWLGGFETNFLRAVSLGVARQLGSIQVTTFPSSAGFLFDAQIRIRIDDMIVVDDEMLRVRIRCAVLREQSGVPPVFFLHEVAIPIEDDSTEGFVNAHDEALASFVAKIVAELSRQSVSTATAERPI
jgi:uncharacterized protein